MTIEPTLDSSLTGLRRLAAWIGGLALVGLLVIARGLEPDASGQGTHQQLGLPPCTMIAVFGVPCPSCGMTTSWAHLARGEAWPAARANLGGMLLALVTLVVGPWLILSAWSARWVGWKFDENLLLKGIAVVAVVTALDWLRRILLPDVW